MINVATVPPVASYLLSSSGSHAASRAFSEKQFFNDNIGDDGEQLYQEPFAPHILPPAVATTDAHQQGTTVHSKVDAQKQTDMPHRGPSMPAADAERIFPRTYGANAKKNMPLALKKAAGTNASKLRLAVPPRLVSSPNVVHASVTKLLFLSSGIKRLLER